MRRFVGYFLLLPSLIIMSLFVFWPFLYSVYLSFFKWNMVSPDKVFVGLDNYSNLLTNPDFYKVLGNSLLYIGIFVIASFALPYFASFLIAIVIKKFIPLYKNIFFIPAVLSLVVASMVFLWILNPISGPIAIFLQRLGLSMPMWSNLEGWVIVVIALITSWKVFGYNFIVLYAAIASVDREAIEIAKLDNIPLWRIFVNVVIPMSSSTGIYILIMTIVQGLQFVFTPIKLITKGGPNGGSSNLIYMAYQRGFEMYKVGEASALSVITLLLFILLLWLEFRFVERKVYYEN